MSAVSLLQTCCFLHSCGCWFVCRHLANYQSRGSFNAPEQLGFSGGDDGYRALLSPGTSEADIDTCVPSTLLVAMMLRWMLVFEERDADTIWLLKMAPRRFFPGHNATGHRDRNRGSREGETAGNEAGFLSVRRAVTRFGLVSFSVDSERIESQAVDAVPSRLQLVVNVSLVLHGRGFVLAEDGLLLAIRLRDPEGSRSLRFAKVVDSNISGPQVMVRDVDSAGENVAVQISRHGLQYDAAGTHESPREVTFRVVAQLE